MQFNLSSNFGLLGIAVKGSFANGSQLARGRDAEFLRYLAGTHHISEAFSRAGIQDGVTAGWILYLPKPILNQVRALLVLAAFRL